MDLRICVLIAEYLFLFTHLLMTYDQIREREDDEIVEALNKYTVKLQTSLKLINSTDM